MKKTYEEVVEKPRLVIRYDENADSPREWSNLGYFITKESRNISPDGKDNRFYEVMLEAESEASNTEEHIEAMKRIYNEDELLAGEKLLAIYPVYKYEHSGVVYRRGKASGFDYSNCGFYFITENSAKEIGTKKKDFEKVIDEELKIYSQWANGEVYGYTLYDEKGELEDSCWGFYSLDEIKDSLPDEWKDENLSDYLK